MNIEIREVESAIVVAVTGDIDAKTAPEAQLAVLGAMKNGGRVLLDLSNTGYMSSAGLRMLLLVHRESTARAARFVLLGVRSEVQDVMSATGFLRFFTLADSVDSAVTMMA